MIPDGTDPLPKPDYPYNLLPEIPLTEELLERAINEANQEEADWDAGDR